MNSIDITSPAGSNWKSNRRWTAVATDGTVLTGPMKQGECAAWEADAEDSEGLLRNVHYRFVIA